MPQLSRYSLRELLHKHGVHLRDRHRPLLLEVRRLLLLLQFRGGEGVAQRLEVRAEPLSPRVEFDAHLLAQLPLCCVQGGANL